MTKIPHYHFETLSSTQEKAFELGNHIEVRPFLVTADFQTAGRGRLERVWEMERGRSFAGSLAFRLPVSMLQGLSLAVGVGICRAIPLQPLKIKWPNDIMIQDSKVGGVLVETRAQSDLAEVVVGIGLNLFDLQSRPYRGLKIQDFSSGEFIESVWETLQEFSRVGFTNLRHEFLTRMWKRRELARLRVGQDLREVLLEGVAPSGHLIIGNQGGELELTDQGEIVVGSS